MDTTKILLYELWKGTKNETESNESCNKRPKPSEQRLPVATPTLSGQTHPDKDSS